MSKTIHHWTVPADWSNKVRLDRVLMSELSLGLSRSRIQDLIKQGYVRLNGHPCSSNDIPVANDRVQIEIPEIQKSVNDPEILNGIDYVFQDEHLLIVNKPPGISVHPSSSETSGTLVNHLLATLPDLKGIGGEERPGIVHRIDKFTSGLLVIAKTEETHRKLVDIFSKHQIQRSYWALCYGSLGSAGGPSLRVETLIGRNPQNRLKMTTEIKVGRKAISHFQALENYRLKNKNQPFACWVQATLETGRTHQVRVHLTSKNCSILGDPLYGKPTENQSKWTQIPSAVQDLIRELPGQALHARSLGFLHPITAEKLFFEADPPRAFQALHAKLKEYL